MHIRWISIGKLSVSISISVQTRKWLSVCYPYPWELRISAKYLSTDTYPHISALLRVWWCCMLTHDMAPADSRSSPAHGDGWPTFVSFLLSLYPVWRRQSLMYTLVFPAHILLFTDARCTSVAICSRLRTGGWRHEHRRADTSGIGMPNTTDGAGSQISQISFAVYARQ